MFTKKKKKKKNGFQEVEVEETTKGLRASDVYVCLRNRALTELDDNNSFLPLQALYDCTTSGLAERYYLETQEFHCTKS